MAMDVLRAAKRDRIGDHHQGVGSPFGACGRKGASAFGRRHFRPSQSGGPPPERTSQPKAKAANRADLFMEVEECVAGQERPSNHRKPYKMAVRTWI
jgi:hypothetical protein